MGARKSPVRSLVILLAALLVNGSILALVSAEIPYPGGMGRSVERGELDEISNRPGSISNMGRDPRRVILVNSQQRWKRTRRGTTRKQTPTAISKARNGSNSPRQKPRRERQIQRAPTNAKSTRLSPPRVNRLVLAGTSPAAAGDAQSLETIHERGPSFLTRPSELRRATGWTNRRNWHPRAIRKGSVDRPKIHWEAVIRLDPRDNWRERHSGQI